MELLKRKRIIEYTRRYLRENDFAVGYIPQLIYKKKASEIWSLYWYCVRKLDDASDSGIKLTSSRFNDFLEYLNTKDEHFRDALQLFLEETNDIIPRSLLEEIYSSVALEKKFYRNNQPQSFKIYKQLIKKRSVIPFYINGLINGIDPESPYLFPMCESFSTAIQLLDDLMDLNIDMEKGRLYITREELKILNIKPEEVPYHHQPIASLRNKLFLEISSVAYRLSFPFWDTNFGLHVRSVIEGAWKMILDERSFPLPKSIFKHDIYYSHFVGATSLPYDVMQVSEDLKYHLFHSSAVNFLRKYKVMDIDEADKLLETMKMDTSSLLKTIGISYKELITEEIEEQIRQNFRETYVLEDGYGLPLAMKENFNNSIERFNDDFKNAIDNNHFQPLINELLQSFIGFQVSFNEELLAKTRDVFKQSLPDQSDTLRKTGDKMIDLIELTQEHSLKFFEEISDTLFSK